MGNNLDSDLALLNEGHARQQATKLTAEACRSMSYAYIRASVHLGQITPDMVDQQTPDGPTLGDKVLKALLYTIQEAINITWNYVIAGRIEEAFKELQKIHLHLSDLGSPFPELQENLVSGVNLLRGMSETHNDWLIARGVKE